MSAERRVAPRQDLRWKCLIIDLAGSIAGPCMMADVSASGAKLELKQSVDVPDEFILLLSSNDVRRQCKVVWRLENHIGVRFVLSPSAVQEAISYLDDTLARIAPKV